MNTYPTLPTAYGSDPRPITKPTIDRAEDGTGRGRSYANDKVSIPVTHPFITAAQKSTLAAFYTANRLLEFTYVSNADGVSRTCMFSAQIAYKREQTMDERYTATVLLEQA